MSADSFWNDVDIRLEQQASFAIPMPDPEAQRAEQSEYETNLGEIRQMVDRWARDLQTHGFYVDTHCVNSERTVLTFSRRCYMGYSGFKSWYDAYGNLVAGRIDRAPNTNNVTIPGDPDAAIHLGRRFSRSALEHFLEQCVLTHIHDSNLVFTHVGWVNFRKHRFHSFLQWFDELAGLEDRQAAGRKLENLLDELFTIEDLSHRGSFRVVGEQIDGTFELDHETYLFEAKWEKDPLDNEPLYAFREKIERKSRFTRGVFLAINGITNPDFSPRG